MPTTPHICRGFRTRLVLHYARFIVAELRLLAALLERAAPGPPAIAFLLFHHEGPHMSNITVPVGSVPFAADVKWLDAAGHETTADTLPVWTSSAPAVATVEASNDGLTGTVTVVGPGAAVIEVSTTETGTGEGDPTPIVAQGTVTVQATDVVIGEVHFTPPA